MARSISFLFVLSCFLFAYSASGEARTLYLMGVIGDSISAGTFAGTAPPRSPTGGPSVEVKDAFCSVETKNSLSWASGTWIDSHYKRLKAYLRKQEPGSDLEVANVAIPGAQTNSLQMQAASLNAAMNFGRYKALKYVTILIGANDLCFHGDTQPSFFSAIEDRLANAFRILASIHQSEPIRILVVGLPRVAVLGLSEFTEAITTMGLTCRDLRDNTMRECRNLTAFSDAQGFQAAITRLADLNSSLEKSVLEADTKFKNKIDAQFTNRFWNSKIEVSDLAFDCFHPNRFGHEKIAEQLWIEQPWFH